RSKPGNSGRVGRIDAVRPQSVDDEHRNRPLRRRRDPLPATNDDQSDNTCNQATDCVTLKHRISARNSLYHSLKPVPDVSARCDEHCGVEPTAIAARDRLKPAPTRQCPVAALCADSVHYGAIRPSAFLGYSLGLFLNFAVAAKDLRPLLQSGGRLLLNDLR